MSDKEMGCIYYIHCKQSNKGYVGQHNEITPEKRFKSHIQCANTGKVKYLLQNAIKKYGLENFTIEVLSIVPHDALSNMEAYWAEQLETYMWDFPGGYNMVWCGNEPRRGIKPSEETRAKMCAVQKGRIITEEAKQKLREANLGKKQSPETLAKKRASRLGVPWSDKKRESMMGRKNTEETKKKMSEAQKGRVFSDETKRKMKEAKKSIRKLTDEQVVEIRENKDKLNQKQLAEKYNVCAQLISNVIHHKRGYE